MFAITEVGYLGIGASDLEAWRTYAGELVGMEVVNEGEPDRFYLRMDYWHHRITVHRDDSDDMLYLGLRVAGPEEFEGIQDQLRSAGIEFRLGTPVEAEERRVLELLKTTDPGGNPIEVFHGPEVDYSRPFHPARGMHGGFRTGSQGLGHCFISCEGTSGYRFYRALGMRGSVEYKVPTPDGGEAELVFMHCNDRQHALAFGAPFEKRINHLMIEAEKLDDVGLTHHLVRERGVPVTMTLGKHSNDQMFSFYFINPSGWGWEYGWGGRTPPPGDEYYRGDLYGHVPESPGGFEKMLARPV